MLKPLLIGDNVFHFWPKTVENRAALRTAIGALVAILIAFKFHLQSPYWSGMSVVIVANLYTGSIIDKALMRITGTVIGAVLGYYLAGLIANSFLLYLLCSFLIIAMSVYFYYYSKHGYAYLLGALCAFIIISQVAIDPQNAFLVAVWRPVEIAIGVIVFAFSVYAIFPNHLKDNINHQLNELFDDVTEELQAINKVLHESTSDMKELVSLNLKIKKKLRKASELLGSLNREIGVSQHQVDELRAIIDSFFTITRQVHYLTSISIMSNDLIIIKSLATAPFFQAACEDLEHMKAVFLTKESMIAPLQAESALLNLEKELQSLSATQIIKSDFIYSFIVFLHQLSQNLSFIHSLLAKTPLIKEKNYLTLTKQDRFRSNNDLVKQSIKAGVTVLLALGFWLISNWPGGINGIISSLVISMRLNLLEMKNVIIHRLIGCVLGGGLALTSLALVEMSLYDFIIILFFSVWGFSYFMFKYPKYSYIGLQANIALIIALAQEGGPPALLAPPLQRLAGVVIGIVASFIVANVLWRADVWTMLHRYLAKIYKYISFNLNQTLMVSGQKKIHDLASIFWLSRSLIESLADTHLNDKKQVRLTEIREQFESLVMNQATVSYILTSIDRARACSTAKLFEVDLTEYEKEIVFLYDKKDLLLGWNVDQKLQEIRNTIQNQTHHQQVDFYDLKNLFAYLNALKQLAFSVYENNTRVPIKLSPR